MAIIYYPSSASVYTREVNPGLIEQTIGLTPDTVFIFTTNPQGFTSSLIYNNSASYARTASFTLNGGGGASLTTGSTYQITSSWAISSSWAPSAASVPTYTTISTSSLYWITCSLNNVNEVVNLTGSGNVTYNFTASTYPAAGTVTNYSLLINNTTTTNTSSLSFPSNWIFIGYKPTILPIGKSAILSLTAYDTSSLIAGVAFQA